MTAIGRLAISGGVAALLVLGTAAPAWATEPADPVVTAPTGTVDVTSTQVVATWQKNDGEAIAPARLRLVRPGGSVSNSSATAGATMRFPVTLPVNGTYTAQVEIDWREQRLFGLSDRTGTATSAERSFKVAAPPARPSGVATAVDAGARTVKVTWEKNGEADMRRYEVLRSHNGGDFAKVGAVDHPGTEYVDATTAGAGGDYRYLVVAFRAGVDSSVASQVASDPSALTATSTATVPDPPPPPTTAPPVTTAVSAAAGAPAAAPGTATTAPAPGATGSPGRVDLSGFNNVQARTPRPATPRTVPLPDPGFQGTLPFDVPEGEQGEGGEAVEGGDTGELAADSPSFRELGDEERASDTQRSLALFAGGLLATVLLMHVLWVKGEVKRVPLEAVAPEGPPPSASDEPGPARAARAKAAGRSNRAGSPDWFVPELGVDDGADRALATSGADRRAS